jgi:alkylhydroperoxidase family enzyme
VVTVPVPGTEANAGPSAPRIYDYLIGGHESYAADRALADQLAGEYPGLRALARQNRSFILKAARWTAAMRGTGQFIDLGCGLPMMPALHEAVREAVPLAVVAYVDSDPEVAMHARTAYRDELGLVVVEGDVAGPAAVLADEGLREVIDLARPACAVLGGTLSAMDADVAREAVAGFSEAMAPGSAVVISCISYGDQGLAERMAGLFGSTGCWRNHGEQDVASFFAGAGLRLLHGRVMDVSCWPACPAAGGTSAGARVLGGIGIKG